MPTSPRAFNHSPLSTWSRSLHAAGMLILGGIGVAGYVVVIQPIVAQNRQLQKKAASYRAKLDERDDLLQQHRQASRRLEDRKSRLEELLRRIPASPDQSDFLAQLTKLARTTGVSIRQYVPGDIREAADRSSLQVKIVGEASYPGICRFLHGLAELPRLCQATAVEIHALESSRKTYPLNITLTIYFAPLQNGVSPVTG